MTLDDENKDSDIMVIDGVRYIIPCKLKDGILVRSPENKIKLPIEITEGFHINRRIDYKPSTTIMDKLYNFLGTWRRWT
jgi:hypothetical protein